MHDGSVTGIPIEYLFLIIGGLLSAIYFDVKKDLKSLKRNADTRAITITRMSLALRFVCRKLKIPFDANDDGDDDDSAEG